MKRAPGMGWGRTMALGAGSALAIGLGSGMLSPALAQTGSAALASGPVVCPALEALVSDEVDGPDPWGKGEVIRFAGSASQGTLTNNLSPVGAPNLDSPEDMAFDLNRVDLATGNRTEVFSNRLQSGTWKFDMPYDVVRNGCNNSFYVLHTGATGVPGNVLRVDGGSGARTLFGTYIASSPQSNYSLLMRPIIVVPGGGGPGGPGGGGGGL
jgi:hypothetical protein